MLDYIDCDDAIRFDALRKSMKKYKVTQSEIASITGYSRTYVSNCFHTLVGTKASRDKVYGACLKMIKERKEQAIHDKD